MQLTWTRPKLKPFEREHKYTTPSVAIATRLRIALAPSNLLRRERSTSITRERSTIAYRESFDWRSAITNRPWNWGGTSTHSRTLVEANLYIALAEYDKALADFNKVLSLRLTDRERARVLNSRGYIFNQRHQYDDALADFDAGIALDPENESLVHNRGASFLDHFHQPKNALNDFDRALELTSRDNRPYILESRARALVQLDRYDEAVADLNESLALQDESGRPLDGITHSARALVYCKSQRYQLALRDYEMGLQLNQDSPFLDRRTPYAFLTFAYFLLHCPDSQILDFTRANSLAQEAIQKFPDSDAAWNTLGQAHYRQNDYHSAIDALNRARELKDYEVTHKWLFLAMVHSKIGNKIESRRYYEQAVKWMTNNPRTHGYFWANRFRKEAEKLLGLENADDMPNHNARDP